MTNSCDTAADGGPVTAPSRTPVETLPAALRHTFAAYPTGVAAEAERVVRLVLAERLADRSTGAWGGSRLTGDGYPVEVAFSTADDRLRLTVEPGPADLDPRRRLDLVIDRMVAVGGPPLPDEVADRMTAAQARGSLRYGAWLACRVTPDGSAFKVYVEVPDPTTRWPGCPAPVLDDREVSLRMVAHTPTTGVTETYLRVPSLLPEHLPALLDPAGLVGLAGRVVPAIEVLYGHRVQGRLPGPSVGVSYTSGAEGQVTLHFYARALWGSDGRIRARFAEAVAALGWDPSRYLAVTAPLAGRREWRTRHGIVGLTLDGSSPPSLTVGVRPVAP